MSMPVYLRALEQSDLERTHRWHNDPKLYGSLTQPFRFVSTHAEATWLERRIAYSAEEVNLAICAVGTDEHVGNIYLRNIDWVARTAGLHIFIGDGEMRSRGYGGAAIRLLCDYAFGTLNLRKIHLRVLSDNEAALKAYERAGFISEGVLRAHVFKDGAYRDLVMMALVSGGRA